MKIQPIVSAGFIAAPSVIYSTSVYAYLDPGTGSIILQGAIAAIAGAAFTLKLYWNRIKAFFFKSKSSKKPEKGEPVDNVSEEESNS